MPTITNELSLALYKTFNKAGDPTPEEIAALKAIYVKKKRLTAEENASVISDIFNGGFESDKKDIVKHLLCDHRTLQQSVFGFLLLIVKGQGKKFVTQDYDLRNEATVKMAARLSKVLEAEGDTLPFI